MIVVSPHSPASPDRPVHRLGEADREPLDPSRNRATVHRFDEQMDVIRLHGEVENPETPARRLGETPSKDAKERVRAQ